MERLESVPTESFDRSNLHISDFQGLVVAPKDDDSQNNTNNTSIFNNSHTSHQAKNLGRKVTAAHRAPVQDGAAIGPLKVDIQKTLTTGTPALNIKRVIERKTAFITVIENGSDYSSPNRLANTPHQTLQRKKARKIAPPVTSATTATATKRVDSPRISKRPLPSPTHVDELSFNRYADGNETKRPKPSSKEKIPVSSNSKPYDKKPGSSLKDDSEHESQEMAAKKQLALSLLESQRDHLHVPVKTIQKLRAKPVSKPESLIAAESPPKPLPDPEKSRKMQLFIKERKVQERRKLQEAILAEKTKAKKIEDNLKQLAINTRNQAAKTISKVPLHLERTPVLPSSAASKSASNSGFVKKREHIDSKESYPNEFPKTPDTSLLKTADNMKKPLKTIVQGSLSASTAIIPNEKMIVPQGILETRNSVTERTEYVKYGEVILHSALVPVVADIKTPVKDDASINIRGPISIADTEKTVPLVESIVMQKIDSPPKVMETTTEDVIGPIFEERLQKLTKQIIIVAERLEKVQHQQAAVAMVKKDDFESFMRPREVKSPVKLDQSVSVGINSLAEFTKKRQEIEKRENAAIAIQVFYKKRKRLREGDFVHLKNNPDPVTSEYETVKTQIVETMKPLQIPTLEISNQGSSITNIPAPFTFNPIPIPKNIIRPNKFFDGFNRDYLSSKNEMTSN